MIVYGAVLSPFVRKVLAVAAEKGIEVELKQGGFGTGGDEFAETSPFGKVPGFRHPGGSADGSDYCLSDSSAIVHYLDARFPEPRLIPEEPCARGRVVWFDEFADTILMAGGGPIFFNRVVKPLFLKQSADAEAADAAEAGPLPKALAWLDGELAGRSWLVGDSFCLADIAVAVSFVNIRAGGVAIDAATYPNLVQWLERVEARPSLAEPAARMNKIIDRARAAAAA